MGTILPPADALLARVADLLARVVRVQEAIADGDLAYAAAAAEGLELDLVALKEHLAERSPSR